MATAFTLPLSIVCNVTVNVTPQAPPTPAFNQALIVGPSTVIPSQGANSRVRQYYNTSQMITDGFTSIMPEYLAAQTYFDQVPAPQIVWIGCQDATAMRTAVPGASAGTGYVVGDVLGVTQAGASAGTVRVTTIGAAGTITGVSVMAGGTHYSIATGLATTGGSGTGGTINITAIGETALTALQQCRIASSQWWGCMSTTAVTSDHLAIAAWIQGSMTSGCYVYATQDANVPGGGPTTVFAQMQALSYFRAMGIYSTTQGGLYPNDIYAAAAVLGEAMGMNTGLANSYFTMKFKPLAGVAPEPLSPSQIATIEAQNGNLYLSYANSFVWFEQGKMPNGQYFDEVLNLDMIASDIQYSVVDLLTGQPAVPMTDAGEAQLLAVCNGACARAVTRGFIAPGVWTGQPVLGLMPGDPLPLGYLSQAQSFQYQSPSDQAARKAMPIYVTIIETGAVHSVTIGVYVQR